MGAADGAVVGPAVGAADGFTDGATVGPAVGPDDGATVGAAVGPDVGATVGPAVGPAVGSVVGFADGFKVGSTVVGFAVGFLTRACACVCMRALACVQRVVARLHSGGCCLVGVWVGATVGLGCRKKI